MVGRSGAVAVVVLLSGFAVAGLGPAHAQDEPLPAARCVQSAHGYTCFERYEQSWTTEDGRTVTTSGSNCVTSGGTSITGTEARSSGGGPTNSHRTSSTTCSGSGGPQARP